MHAQLNPILPFRSIIQSKLEAKPADGLANVFFPRVQKQHKTDSIFSLRGWESWPAFHIGNAEKQAKHLP